MKSLFFRYSFKLTIIALLLAGIAGAEFARAAEPAKDSDSETVLDQHASIGLGQETVDGHTTHPDAQWFPDAGLGLFLHWGVSSVRAMNISWPMIPGRALANRHLDDAERERVLREMDYNLNGRPPEITPNEYWSMAKDFNPQDYDPDKWLAAAAKAGFKYAVLTAKHHEGFALWPTAYGDFNTKNYMGGRDLIKPFVEACRRNGLKVGLYFSGPDWHYDREYMSFLYGRAQRKNPEFPSIGPDLKPRTKTKTPEEIAAHQAAYAELVRGQIEELLTRYGQIDVLWFDGKPAVPNADKIISVERIRELQPGIVINPRLHGHGDYVTYERNLTTDKVAKGWAEFCNTWTSNWPHVETPFRANGFILSDYVRSRSLGINYLLGVGPMSNGEFTPKIYENMKIVEDWMKANGVSVQGTKPLPENEKASVPATAVGNMRYLFALPRFRDGGKFPEDQLPARDETLTISGIAKPVSVQLLAGGQSLQYTYDDDKLTVELPASSRTDLVDVVQVTMSK